MQNPGSSIYQPLNLLTFGKDIDLERLKSSILKAWRHIPTPTAA